MRQQPGEPAPPHRQFVQQQADERGEQTVPQHEVGGLAPQPEQPLVDRVGGHHDDQQQDRGEIAPARASRGLGPGLPRGIVAADVAQPAEHHRHHEVGEPEERRPHDELAPEVVGHRVPVGAGEEHAGGNEIQQGEEPEQGPERGARPASQQSDDERKHDVKERDGGEGPGGEVPGEGRLGAPGLHQRQRHEAGRSDKGRRADRHAPQGGGGEERQHSQEHGEHQGEHGDVQGIESNPATQQKVAGRNSLPTVAIDVQVRQHQAREQEEQPGRNKAPFDQPGKGSRQRAVEAALRSGPATPLACRRGPSRRFFTGRFFTGRFLTGRFLTGRFLTGRFLTGCRGLRGGFAGRDVTGSGLPGSDGGGRRFTGGGVRLGHRLHLIGRGHGGDVEHKNVQRGEKPQPGQRGQSRRCGGGVASVSRRRNRRGVVGQRVSGHATSKGERNPQEHPPRPGKESTGGGEQSAERGLVLPPDSPTPRLEFGNYSRPPPGLSPIGDRAGHPPLRPRGFQGAGGLCAAGPGCHHGASLARAERCLGWGRLFPQPLRGWGAIRRLTRN